MGSAAFTYPPGGTSIRTEAPGFGGEAGLSPRASDPELIALMRTMARRKAAMQGEMGDLALQQARLSLKQQGARRHVGGGERVSVGTMSPAQKYAAALRPRHAFGSGNLHYELDERFLGDPDIRAMLPQSSHLAGPSLAALDREADEDFDRFARDMAQRRAAAGGGTYFVSGAD